jgi:acyl carrier protein
MEELFYMKDKIRHFIVKSSYLPEEKVKNETLIFAQGILDSMGFITLINFLEESFSLKANDSDLMETNFESVNAIAEFVVRKLQTEHVMIESRLLKTAQEI